MRAQNLSQYSVILPQKASTEYATQWTRKNGICDALQSEGRPTLCQLFTPVVLCFNYI